MSGNSTVASQSTVAQNPVSQNTVSHTGGGLAAQAQDAGSRAAVPKSESSARWAALDSRHERLVTAADAVLADPDRKNDRRIAS